MPSTVRIYSSSDISAPQLNSSNCSLVNVLQACLVTGYGSKNAAGWTQIGPTANCIALKGSGRTNCWLYVEDSMSNINTSGSGNNRVAHIRGFESITNLYANGAVNTNSAPFPTFAQINISNGLFMVKSGSLNLTNREWILIADENCFYFFNEYGANANASTFVGYSQHFFGDFISWKTTDMYNCAVLASDSTSLFYSVPQQNGSIGQLATSPTTNHKMYIARRFDQTTNSIQACLHTLTFFDGAQKVLEYPHAPDNSAVWLTPILIGASSNIFGQMPGIYTASWSRFGASSFVNRSYFEVYSGWSNIQVPGASNIANFQQSNIIRIPVSYATGSTGDGVTVHRFIDITGPWF